MVVERRLQMLWSGSVTKKDIHPLWLTHIKVHSLLSTLPFVKSWKKESQDVSITKINVHSFSVRLPAS
jgi:hypothetical protein